MIYDKASGRHTVREKFSKLLNTHKYKSHNRLEEDEKVYLKIRIEPYLSIGFPHKNFD